MRKSFDELTIADDYMFCKIMLSSDRHPCLSDDTEFCVPQNIASVGTTAIHGGFWISLFENRRSRFKELGKKVPQAYRVYVEDTFLPCDAEYVRIFSKSKKNAVLSGSS